MNIRWESEKPDLALSCVFENVCLVEVPENERIETSFLIYYLELYSNSSITKALDNILISTESLASHSGKSKIGRAHD